MNSSIHLQQLVKWTIPTVAFVFALFWYKRRRSDRGEAQWNDPGGITEETAYKKNTKEADTSLYDSSVQEDNQSSINCSCTKQKKESSRVPGKVSESVLNKSSSQNSSSCDSSQNNNRTNYSEMIAESQIVSSFESDNVNISVTKTFQDAAGETKQPLQCKTESYDPNYNQSDQYDYSKNSQNIKKYTNDAIKIQGRTNERDSANHSPISEVSGGSSSLTDESEESMDSGKGSIVPGRNNKHKKDNTESTYDFAIPQHLVGRLIGRHGTFLQSIRTKAGVDIYVNDHPCNGDHKICSIQGSVEGINVALKIIRQKFPEKKFPQMTLVKIPTTFEMNEAVHNVVYTPCIPCTLSLTEQVSNDVIISHIVKPSWLFVQLPTHPTYPHLQNLENQMLDHYNKTTEFPSVEITRGHYVAVFWHKKWVRGLIEKIDTYGEKNIIRLIDHGGYWSFNNSEYKPLTLYFLQALPFQAIEIFVANIQPKKSETWSPDAYDSAYEICHQNGVAEAHVVGRIGDNVYTNIYFYIKEYGHISFAEELIAKGHAEHVALEDTKPESFESICT
ncbi:KH domain-containing protein akap-1 [Pseudomyrmex gracilis]|uniref:KH domain-containing protein akap-1 n=1 Tax=Pseudomyrmex gracilis TaxID=219809 RepID=UPI0009948F15|nr:KH domain-containing protein akap-1 [Pseudomyrmex gracilis]XP_020286200.1 KH domain-containing protein akap-1 [Pseudomyrmex gracilis]